MAKGILHAKAIPWGGSIGLRISRAEAKRLGIKEGQEIDLKVMTKKDRLDVSHFPTFNDGGVAARDHDRILGEAHSRELGLK